ncbi:MAG: S-layer protein domain-containing protein [Methanosarcina sp.]|nr:S-layer protein domain-containing protein [Methanosarcina sp.]MDD3873055.1 S-layer protein domain-containing protein [Methanosarcina sp.]MDD4521982.1 S-layer protein domain-containing protein [Methanosarcina sp.]
MGTKNYMKILCLFLVLGLLCTNAAAQVSDLTGNRIWDENANQNLTYTWTPQTYSGFYYDLDTGEGSENLTVQLSKGSRTIEEKNLQYETKPIQTAFKHKNWGSYQVIGFMAERYFAGYTANSSFANKDLSVISEGQLSKVLTDTDDRKSLYTGSSLILEDGYSLNIVEVDVKGNTVWVQLEKDGNIIDNAFLPSNSDYVYKTGLGSAEDVPIIAVYFSQIFSGRETNAVFIQGIFQISDQSLKVRGGDDFGKMEVSSISSSGIKMRNSDSISLSKGNTIDVMGKLIFVVADASELRFAPIVKTTEPGTYELRGTVHDEKFDTSVWTPFNFEGFYYNIDDNVSTESLVIEKLNDRTIDDKMLVYSTKPARVEFEHKGWGNYEVVGFMAEKYFAGYPENTFGNSKGVSVLSDRILSKVLIDDDNKKSLFTGSSLALENGYTLKAAEVDINGEKVLFELYKDGKLVDSGVVFKNEDYIYKADIGGAENVPVITVHVSTVFRSRETDAVFVEGIFQISEDYLKVAQGDSFGKMEVSSISSSGITMKNEDSISLSRDEVINLMGNVKFRVADASVLRFYPFVEIKTEAGDQLNIEMPDVLIAGRKAEVLVMARNVSVGGVEVFVGTTSVGTTGDDGNLTFTPSREGSFTVTANRAGYVSGSKDIDVVAEGVLKLMLSVTPTTVREGDQINIKVIDSVGKQPIAGADVFFGGKKIDKQTDAKGTISHWVTAPGTYTINATKSGYEEGENVIEVIESAAQFTFSDLTVKPASVEAGTPVKIRVNAVNNGTVAGESKVELLVNNKSVDSKNVTLSSGESTEVEFSHTEDKPGTYTVQVGGLSKSYEVIKKAPFFSGIATLGILATAFVVLRRRRN